MRGIPFLSDPVLNRVDHATRWREMDHLKPHTKSPDEKTVKAASWQPEVLESTSGDSSLPADFDLDGVWHWLHARLRALGNLSYDDARLTALLHWNEITVCNAVHAARLKRKELDYEGSAVQIHLEFLTAEYMARQILEEQEIPSPELHSA